MKGRLSEADKVESKLCHIVSPSVRLSWTSAQREKHHQDHLVWTKTLIECEAAGRKLLYQKEYEDEKENIERIVVCACTGECACRQWSLWVVVQILKPEIVDVIKADSTATSHGHSFHLNIELFGKNLHNKTQRFSGSVVHVCSADFCL